MGVNLLGSKGDMPSSDISLDNLLLRGVSVGRGGGAGDESGRGDIDRLNECLDERRDGRGVIYGVLAGEGKAWPAAPFSSSVSHIVIVDKDVMLVTKLDG